MNTIIDSNKDMDAAHRLDRDEFINQTLDHDHLPPDKQCKIQLYCDNASNKECKDVMQSNDNYSNLGLSESYSKKIWKNMRGKKILQVQDHKEQV